MWAGIYIDVRTAAAKMTLQQYFDAAVNGDLSIVKRLSSTMAGKTNAEHQTALMLAAQHGQKDVVRYLTRFEAGCRDDCGMKAVDYAQKSARDECYAVLRELEVLEGQAQGYAVYARKRQILSGLTLANDRLQLELRIKQTLFLAMLAQIIICGVALFRRAFLS